MRLRKRLEELEQEIKTLERRLASGERLLGDYSTTQEVREMIADDHADISRELDNLILDYTNLYDKVRTNLAKLAKRAETVGGDGVGTADNLARYRQLLAEKKLRGSG